MENDIAGLAIALRSEALCVLRASEGDTYATEMLRAADYLLLHSKPDDLGSRRTRDAIGVLVVRDMKTSGLPSLYDGMMKLAIALASIE